MITGSKELTCERKGSCLKSPSFKKALRFLGNLATLAAVFYLLATLVDNADRITIVFSGALAFAVALFMCTHLLQARIIQIILNQDIAYWALLKIHSASQIYKYIPGNVAHFFSRWLYLKNRGVQARDNARLILYETTLLVAAFGLLGGAFFVVWPWPFGALPAPYPVLMAGVGAAGLAVAVYGFRTRAGRFFNAKTLSVLLLYILSAIVSGLILSLLAACMIPDIKGIGIVPYTLGFTVAFLAGYVVPGSPGGIGIREFVFVELFSFSGNEAYLLIQLMVVFRLTAVVTELLMFAGTKIFVRDPI